MLEVLKTANYIYNLGSVSVFFFSGLQPQSHREMSPEGYKGVKIL